MHNLTIPKPYFLSMLSHAIIQKNHLNFGFGKALFGKKSKKSDMKHFFIFFGLVMYNSEKQQRSKLKKQEQSNRYIKCELQ